MIQTFKVQVGSIFVIIMCPSAGLKNLKSRVMFDIIYFYVLFTHTQVVVSGKGFHITNSVTISYFFLTQLVQELESGVTENFVPNFFHWKISQFMLYVFIYFLLPYFVNSNHYYVILSSPNCVYFLFFFAHQKLSYYYYYCHDYQLQVFNFTQVL